MSSAEIERLLDNATTKSTVKSTKFGKRIFDEWLASPSGAKFAKPIEDMSKEELNTCLKYFYTSARKQDGSYYKASSLKTIRAAIDRYLRSPPHYKQFSIVSDAAFSEANRVLFAFVKDLKMSGKIEGVIHKQAITKEQVQKLYDSGQLGPANSYDPAQLQRTVWFYIGLYFGRRGRENQREMKSGMLSLRRTPQGVEYFELNRKMPASTSPLANAKDELDAKVMFSVAGSSRCPVMTIKNYLSHLNPTSDLLFQRPRDNRSLKFKTEDVIWYSPGPLGKTTLEKVMTEMSKRAGIEPRLTKHCLKATSVALLSGSSYCTANHRVQAETAGTSDQAIKSHYNTPSLEQQQHTSAILGNFFTSVGPGARIIAPVGAKVVATVIEIEQQQDSAGEIILQVRKKPIVLQQPQNQLAVSSSLNTVNVLFGYPPNSGPPPCNVYSVQMQKTSQTGLVPLAPRPEK